MRDERQEINKEETHNGPINLNNITNIHSRQANSETNRQQKNSINTLTKSNACFITNGHAKNTKKSFTNIS